MNATVTDWIDDSEPIRPSAGDKTALVLEDDAVLRPKLALHLG